MTKFTWPSVGSTTSASDSSAKSTAKSKLIDPSNPEIKQSDMSTLAKLREAFARFKDSDTQPMLFYKPGVRTGKIVLAHVWNIAAIPESSYPEYRIALNGVSNFIARSIERGDIIVPTSIVTLPNNRAHVNVATNPNGFVNWDRQREILMAAAKPVAIIAPVDWNPSVK